MKLGISQGTKRERAGSDVSDNNDGSLKKITTQENQINFDFFQAIKNKLIALVERQEVFDAAFFKDLTIENLMVKPINDQSLFWWFAWAFSKGYGEPFEFIWLKLNNQLQLTDLLERTNDKPSPLSLLAQGMKFRKLPFKMAWEQLPHTAFSPEMLHALVTEAKKNEEYRAIIDRMISEIPYIFNDHDLSFKPSETVPSINDLIHHEALSGESYWWCLRLQRKIAARNKFFETIRNLKVVRLDEIIQRAREADKEGYTRAPRDAEIIVTVLQCAQKGDWMTVFALLEQHANNVCINSEAMYDALYAFANRRNQVHILAINKINQHFKRNRLYTQADFSTQLDCIKYNYNDSFKQPSACFAHALLKKDSQGKVCQAKQYLFNASTQSPNMVKLNNINCVECDGIIHYCAQAGANQTLFSTDSFHIQVQTKVDSEFVLEEYELVLFEPTGLFPSHPIEPLTKEVNAETDEYPTERGGERNITVTDMQMRHAYPDSLKNNYEDMTNALQCSAKVGYQEFLKQYNAFFTEGMAKVTKHTGGLYSPQILHAIAKMFFRPEEKHYDVNNLAIAPKWVNSLMMVIEFALSWHVLSAPFAKFSLQTLFNTFPLKHVLKDGKMLATIESENTKVSICKDLRPWQSCPHFPNFTDIAQVTFVLNSLLNQQPSESITFTASVPKTFIVHDASHTQAEPADSGSVPGVSSSFKHH